MVPHQTIGDDAALGGVAWILDGIPVDQEPSPPECLSGRIGDEGKREWSMSWEVVRRLDIPKAAGDGADVVDGLHGWIILPVGHRAGVAEANATAVLGDLSRRLIERPHRILFKSAMASAANPFPRFQSSNTFPLPSRSVLYVLKISDPAPVIDRTVAKGFYALRQPSINKGGSGKLDYRPGKYRP